MSKVPGTFKNGNNSNPNIPPTVEWDPDNPQTIFRCTDEIFHSPSCDGNCGSYDATEGLTLLLNEQRDWARLNLNTNINVDAFSLMLRIEMLEEYVRNETSMTEEEWDESFKLRKAARMREMRENIEPQIREAQAKASLAIAQKRILGPNGELLG